MAFSACALLLKVDGGYLFSHRLVLEHFAGLYQFVHGEKADPGGKETSEGRVCSSYPQEQGILDVKRKQGS
jgi:hypothetical protein